MLAAQDFFQGMLMTAREPDELVEAVRFPLKQAGRALRVHRIFRASRRLRDGRVRGGRHATTRSASRSAASRTGRWSNTGRACTGDDLRGALNDLSWKLSAQDDAHISATYRRHLVRQLGWRVIEEAK